MKRMTTLVLLFLLLSGCATSEQLELAPSSAKSWTLPVRFAFNLPVVDVRIGGFTVPVVVDTGSNGTIWLAPEAARRVGVKFTGASSCYYDAHGNKFSARSYVIPECSLDGIQLREVEGREFASAAEGDPKIQGIIGLGVLRHFCVIFDWPHAAMELSTGGLSGRDKFRTVPMRWTSYGIETHMAIDGTEFEFIWDTGASASILKFGRVAERLLARRERHLIYAPGRTQIGAFSLGPLDFYVKDLEQPPGDGIIGANFFMKHRILLDLETGLLGVE